MKSLNVLRYALLAVALVLVVSLVLARGLGYASLEFVPNQPFAVCLFGFAATVAHAIYSTHRRAGARK